MAGRHRAVYCTHCGNPQQGISSVTIGSDEYPLCHPDAGLDCYRLVTVYQHQPVDCPCALSAEDEKKRDWFTPTVPFKALTQDGD